MHFAVCLTLFTAIAAVFIDSLRLAQSGTNVLEEALDHATKIVL